MKIQGFTNAKEWAIGNDCDVTTAMSLWSAMEKAMEGQLTMARRKHNELVEAIEVLIVESVGVVGLKKDKNAVSNWDEVEKDGWLDKKKPIL